MLLVVNAGSSSLKLVVFDAALNSIAVSRVTEIGNATRIDGEPGTAQDHREAFASGLKALGISLTNVTAAVHRVVHGGLTLTAPCKLDPKVIAEIGALSSLAPLHNPPAIAVIQATQQLAPNLPQYAVFDTAFHADNPEVALRYALPEAENRLGIRRYGFHGISYASLVKGLPAISGKSLPPRLLACHLGNGASLCAIKDGRSIATTMGYSPLDGLTMGTRTGSIDGNAVLRLAKEHGIPATERLLNQASGLLALGGHSDMRALHADKSDRARFAVEHFIYWGVLHAGSMVTAMKGVDAVAFTGGIGENDAVIRAGIMQGLAWLGLSFMDRANVAHAPCLHTSQSSIKAYIVPAHEERHMAAEALALLGLSASHSISSKQGS